MNKNKYIHSVLPSSKPKKYPKQSPLIDKLNLQKELQKRGLKIELKESLKGGFISQVYSAVLDGQEVVIKHTEGAFPFDPTELYLDKKSHKVDVQVLKNLQNNQEVRVPKLLYDFPDITTSIMENLYSKGFSLMQEDIFKNRFSIKAAKNVGRSLAHLILESRKWKEFPYIVQNAQMSIYERGLELRLSYPNSQKEYSTLEKEYLTNNEYFSWPDCHPKNVFVNEKGEVAFIDFGYSQWADQRFMFPSHLAHIVLYALAGYIKKDSARKYLMRCINSFKEIEPVDEKIFCHYLAMEVFHRANGKWVQGIETKKQKLSLIKFGMTVFDDKIISIKNLLKLF
ncbi:MAG: hypothetical protein US40_C0003G0062 [Candidatus Roizmanbacteria bacterium GW2011_GWC2_37_13]|uniref:Aminoglycoside phosphotransferase domain-containing protein n=1 Tax=Candidatus Roizmanbacteria bacterium GW2011_GWC2_37_13 TaxID=1618486 RepID=A0A0G0GJB5_9BACT|nr:MAG: hypothetical protein US38_C0004G0061 [Candidatus Roizmanbacteria bacterium GW2011_GWC1_37_12]KKQ26210.1 MAG: hypothetical protein US40_C0003G0062 [Candidatus Roizmanbacteria bacterium GW2011_GWC2_37_13]